MTNDQLADLLVEKGGPGSGRYPAGSGEKWAKGRSAEAARAAFAGVKGRGGGLKTANREYYRARGAFRRDRPAEFKAGAAPKVVQAKPAAAVTLQPPQNLSAPQSAFTIGWKGPQPGEIEAAQQIGVAHQPAALVARLGKPQPAFPAAGGEQGLQGQAAGGAGAVVGEQAMGGPSIGHPGSGSVEQLQANIERLASTPITKDKIIGDDAHGNVSVTRMLTFKDGSKAVFKPEVYRGNDRVIRQNLTPGFNTQREVGAWEVAKTVGMEDLVPAVIPATIKGEKGALMAFVPGEKGHETVGLKYSPDRYAKYDGEHDHARAAVFDFVIGNEDRHQGNWLMDRVPGAPGKGFYTGDIQFKGSDFKMGLIDHGLAFPDKAAYKVNGYNQKMAEGAATRSKMGALSGYVKPYVDNKATIIGKLHAAGVPAKGVAQVAARIDHLASLKDDWSKIGAPYKQPARRRRNFW